jgi:hypothetical protein
LQRGLPGAGHILVFNNGMRRTGGAYSSVDEIVPPVDSHGQYSYTAGKPYGPDAPVWSYSAPKRTDFFSSFISGAHRLPNGNTFICAGANGTFFEVTPTKETVWKYLNPVLGIPSPDASIVPKLGQMVPPRLHNNLELTPQQRKELTALDKEIAAQLDKILTDDQKKRPVADRPGGPPPPDQPGHIIPANVRARLKLTDAQQEQVAALQKEAEGKLDKILDEEQKVRFKGMRDKGKGPPPRPPGPPGGGFGPPGGGGIFRATRYPADYVGLKGRELKPGKTIEEMLAAKPQEK